jgi:four helix bundle protein
MYPKMFVSKIIDAAGEGGETEVWLDFARDCKYMALEKYEALMGGYSEVNRMLFSIADNPEKFVKLS